MNRKLLVALAGVAVFAQAQAQFEVASIRPSAPLTQDVKAGVHIDGAQVSCVQLSLKDYIGAAYKVKVYQIQGPDWLSSARFDITAKLPDGATPTQVPEMLGALLADRFQMKIHRESKELPVYGLVVAKGGLKMKELPADAPEAEADKGAVNVASASSNTGTVVDLGKGSSVSILYASSRIEAKKVAMAGFASLLERFTDRPVVDMTGVQGSYDFTLDFAPEDFRAMLIRSAVIAGATLPPEALKLLDNVNGDTMFSALETIGLKLEGRKAPLDMLVIDQMEKTPSEN